MLKHHSVCQFWRKTYFLLTVPSQCRCAFLTPTISDQHLLNVRNMSSHVRSGRIQRSAHHLCECGEVTRTRRNKGWKYLMWSRVRLWKTCRKKTHWKIHVFPQKPFLLCRSRFHQRRGFIFPGNTERKHTSWLKKRAGKALASEPPDWIKIKLHIVIWGLQDGSVLADDDGLFLWSASRTRHRPS